MESFDIKTAFLTGDADVPIFTIQLKRYEDGSSNVMLLDQSVYGTKQAHRKFNAGLKERFVTIGLHSTKVDDSLYTKRVGSSFVHIHMHVDNGMVFCNDKQMITQVKKEICGLYDVKWDSNPTEHLGIKIHRDRSRRMIHLSQESYLQHVLNEHMACLTQTRPRPLFIRRLVSTPTSPQPPLHLHFRTARSLDPSTTLPSTRAPTSATPYQHWQNSQAGILRFTALPSNTC